MRKAELAAVLAGLGGDMVRYEQGRLDDIETFDLFQRLVDTGLVWDLQGHYVRAAHRLLDCGLIKEREGGHGDAAEAR